MQIQNNYHSFSDAGYQNPHTHHFTKCLHEEEHHRQTGAAGGMRGDALESLSQEQKKDQEELSLSGFEGERKAGGLKRGLGRIKGIWEAMGDEGKEEAAKISSLQNPSQMSGIQENTAGVSSLIRQGLPARIINKWEYVRGKIKTGIKAALKRFGRDKDAFETLSDPKGRFAGKKEAGEQYPQKPGNGTRKQKNDLLTTAMEDTHLMDSYSKKGEYCRLNENLTYQKNRTEQKLDKLD